MTVYTPQYIVGHWWENILHNHAARRIRHKLMLVHGVMVTLVPWLLDSSDLIYGRRSRPLPGQDRRGEPLRPVMRRAMPPAKTSRNGGKTGAKAAGRKAEDQEPGPKPDAATPQEQAATSK